MDLIIVTGMSGAGKSQAIHCLEDLGFYCVDNIPPRLIVEFANMANSEGSELSKVALVVDIRGGVFFAELRETLDELGGSGDFKVKVMFLDCSDAVLMRRYKETRRAHPLAGDGSVRDGISAERKALEPIKDRADFIIDTTLLKPAGLNAEINRLLQKDKKEDSFTVTISSFGYKYGMLDEADWVMDARFLPNPFYKASMKKLTGNNRKVREYVLRSPSAEVFLNNTALLITELIPSYIREGKYSLFIGIGCTGGRHRSVAVASALSEMLANDGRHVVLLHRDIDK